MDPTRGVKEYTIWKGSKVIAPFHLIGIYKPLGSVAQRLPMSNPFVCNPVIDQMQQQHPQRSICHHYQHSHTVRTLWWSNSSSLSFMLSFFSFFLEFKYFLLSPPLLSTTSDRLVFIINSFSYFVLNCCGGICNEWIDVVSYGVVLGICTALRARFRFHFVWADISLRNCLWRRWLPIPPLFFHVFAKHLFGRYENVVHHQCHGDGINTQRQENLYEIGW